MPQVHGFTYGPLTPLLAYFMSCVGSALGLKAMTRARALTGTGRYRWLALAAISIGGTGIWVMHFIAMLGFTITATAITYDLPMTIASMLVAVATVGVGLGIVVTGAGRLRPLLVGGTVTGLGVACMHYLGMAAMRMPERISYDMTLFTASIAIAVVAATAALWATMHIRGTLATTGAALVMGVAVSGMHYTGMAALRVTPMTAASSMDMGTGMSATQLLAPLIIGVSATTLIILFLVVLAPPEHEIRTEAELNRNLEAIRARQH